MTDAERKEMEEVTHWALVKTLTGQFPAQVYQEVGFSEREIKEALNDHLCRCASHNRIVRAVQRAAKEMA